MIWHAAIYPWSSRHATSLHLYVLLWKTIFLPLYFYGVQAGIQPTPSSLLHRQHYCAVCGCETAMPEPPHTVYCNMFLQISQINKLTDNFIVNIYIQIQCILLCITLLSHVRVANVYISSSKLDSECAVLLFVISM